MNDLDHKDQEQQEPAEELTPTALPSEGSPEATDPAELVSAELQPAFIEAEQEQKAEEAGVTEQAPLDLPVDDSAPDGIEDQVEDQAAQPESDKSLQWYVVHTYSGYENKAKQALEERIKRDSLEQFFGEILIPTEEVVEMSRGKRRTSKRKFFPGYMLVQMSLSEQTWYLVKSTPKITGFVGNSTQPQPVPESEIRRITNQIAEGSERLKPKVVFEKGDSVRVVDGPFANFNGTVDGVDPEKGKLRVLVSIFGRATPVEMDFVQVEKT